MDSHIAHTGSSGRNENWTGWKIEKEKESLEEHMKRPYEQLEQNLNDPMQKQEKRKHGKWAHQKHQSQSYVAWSVQN